MRNDGEITIRPAIRADYPALVPIAQEILDMHAAAIPSVFRSEGDPLDESYFLDLLAGAAGAVYVAEVAGSIVGFATLTIRRAPSYGMLVARKTATLENLVVTESHRGTGTGPAFRAAPAGDDSAGPARPSGRGRSGAARQDEPRVGGRSANRTPSARCAPRPRRPPAAIAPKRASSSPPMPGCVAWGGASSSSAR